MSLLAGLGIIAGCKGRGAGSAVEADSGAPPPVVDPSTLAMVEVVDSGEPGITIAATRYETLILNKPELKRDVLVDGKEVVRLGILRKGTRCWPSRRASKGGTAPTAGFN